jgi:hypothetical protein
MINFQLKIFSSAYFSLITIGTFFCLKKYVSSVILGGHKLESIRKLCTFSTTLSPLHKCTRVVPFCLGQSLF